MKNRTVELCVCDQKFCSTYNSETEKLFSKVKKTFSPITYSKFIFLNNCYIKFDNKNLNK